MHVMSRDSCQLGRRQPTCEFDVLERKNIATEPCETEQLVVPTLAIVRAVLVSVIDALILSQKSTPTI